MSTRYWVPVARELFERRDEWRTGTGWRWVQPWSTQDDLDDARVIEVEAEDDDPAAAEPAGPGGLPGEP